MATLRLDIVTTEQSVYSDDVDMVIAPGVQGQLGILPHHAPLMTALTPGELVVKKGKDEQILAIGGGFLEVRPDAVVILADSAERAEDIDEARAMEARSRAERLLAEKGKPDMDAAQAEMALRRALSRLTVAERVKRRKPRG